jgi:hypothetical protein
MPYEEVPEVAAQRQAAMNNQILPNEFIPQRDRRFRPASTAIYIFNVSPMAWGKDDGVSRPPNHPHIYIKACPADKDYILTGNLQHPFPEFSFDTVNGKKKCEYTDGYIEATKMLNPMNNGVADPDVPVDHPSHPIAVQNFDDPNQFMVGANLNKFGVFWSTHNPPLLEEVKAAKARLETTYREELKEMSRIEAGVDGVNAAKARANKISYMAASYFNQSTSWNGLALVPKLDNVGKIECPNCAEMVNPAAAVCRFCSAVLDETKARKLFPDRFKNPGGRPPNVKPEEVLA